MKNELPIIDAEFIEIPDPAKTRQTKTTKRKSPHTVEKKAKPTVKAVAVKSPEGRIDLLAAGMLNGIFANAYGTPTPQISKSIEMGVQLLIGKPKVRGPEWNFLKTLMGS